MARTLLQMCQEAADNAGVGQPSAIVGNTDETARRLLAAAQREGQILARRAQNGWVDMIREKTVTIKMTGTADGTTANKLVNSAETFKTKTVTVGDAVENTTDSTQTTVTAVDSETQLTLADDIFVSGEGYAIYRQAHAFPSDYKRLIDDTLWDRSNYWEMRGPLSPAQWQVYKSSVLGATATTRRRWRIRNAGDGYGKVWYIDPQPDVGENDTLVYEYVSDAWCASAAGAAQSRWAADTDTFVLDDFIFMLGVTWRVMRSVGLAYEEEWDEWDEQVCNALGDDTGGVILSLTHSRPESLLTTCNVPDTGFGS